MGAREAGQEESCSSMTWLLVVCRGLENQNESEIKWPGEKLVPSSEKVNPGPSCYTRARGALPSAPSLHLSPAQFWSLLFAFQTAVGARPSNASDLLTSWRGLSWR